MATYINIQTTNDVSVVKSVHRTAALAEAAVEKAKPEVWETVAEPVTDDVEPGWFYTAASGATPASVSFLGEPDHASDRRAELRELWRQQARDFSPLWGDEALYKRRIILNCSAASVDANLADDIRFGVLLEEALIPGVQWYVEHDTAAWTSYATGSASENYYSTLVNGTGVAHANMTLNLAADFNWIAWLWEIA